MNSEYTAIIKEADGCWIGWVEEIPGVTCQEASRDELMISLKEVLKEALEFNRAEAKLAAGTNFTEERIAI